MNPSRLSRSERDPLRIAFLLTSMEVGGAETLLWNLIHRLDHQRFHPQVVCLKERGTLGERLMETHTVHSQLINGKYDIAVIHRLAQLFRSEAIDAVITVGCGDKMFWGRVAAWQAGVPVIISALHSTGWPDGVGRWNRLLTRITDAFIAVAQAHGEHLASGERFPREKIHVIPNGVDTDRFHPAAVDKLALRRTLSLPTRGPLGVMVAALRPEKNHRRFLRVVHRVIACRPDACFAVVGDGPLRDELEQYAASLKLGDAVCFLGNRDDIPEILRASDVFLLTSDNEAAPVSILEASASGVPVLAPLVGSVPELVLDGRTGYCLPPSERAFADQLLQLLASPQLAEGLGQAGREHVVQHGSLRSMVDGYQQLIQAIYDAKARPLRIRDFIGKERAAAALSEETVSG